MDGRLFVIDSSSATKGGDTSNQDETLPNPEENSVNTDHARNYDERRDRCEND